MNRWKPNVTVATVVERKHNNGDKQYLLVHESRDGQNVYNQPAGHLDKGESLLAAAERETLEETGWEVKVNGLIGIYRFIAPNGITYLRHAFSAKPIHHHPEKTLDEGIIEAVWFSYEQIIEKRKHLRSEMVLQAIEDYQEGPLYPLALLREPND
ncbi:MAG: ADP-ribose pyrophosphatase YjhB (NUDIX family) [Candidatus Endobugula sp.]|jgi:ADP-ribose pyrophosphatase YjhB (NUDIX family)